MDTCVRNGIYDEPLDLAAFINRLGMLHPKLKVVQLLMQQVGEGCQQKPARHITWVYK